MKKEKKEESVFRRLAEVRFIPVASFETIEDALWTASILEEAQFPVLEITFRTPCAPHALAKVSKKYPHFLLGAGTLLNKKDVALAKKGGASFGVAPGMNSDVIRYSQKKGLPFIPGAVTPTEIENAVYHHHLNYLKFFPAYQSGGSSMISAAGAPYAHLGVRFMATGGIDSNNLSEYLNNKLVFSAGGGWVLAPALIRTRNREQILTEIEKIKTIIHTVK